MEIKKDDKFSPISLMHIEQKEHHKPKFNLINSIKQKFIHKENGVKTTKKVNPKILVILGILIFIVFILAMYFTFFYSVKCKNIACWDYKIERCSRAIYINDIKDISWKYKIIGRKDSLCEVKAKVIEVRGGLIDSKILEGKEMTCMLPLNIVTFPENDPNLCYGRLKEEMQGLIIKKLHQYILTNLGSINQNLTKIEGISN
ncbi:MAG TPA: hypothetical protein P5277_01515 [Candidatus Paceibacterota bacterium]|nr:hypothetical protein [Candidatus Paceibacterota bacterium]